MSNQTLPLNDQIYQYLLEHSLRETALMRELRELTLKHARARMQIAPEQGQFMALLVELVGARKIIEIGTFTGYSALCMAQAMPADGKLICCDISEEWTSIGQPFWQRAGVADRIDLRIAPALDTLDELILSGEAGDFDMAFIDADKTNCLNYHERCLELLRSGGLLMFDNTLWGGSVADPADQDEDTLALRELNQMLHRDQRISISLVPIGDGLTLARKR
ncbi:MAG: class I SAM-dependent methyltransferase [Chromatiaceae bacterium]|jgi:O-methyltransferase|nr:class I SAM-dependent methyltransferase [Chromatiaceae bacterium]